MRRLKNEKGFVLPLALMLMVILTISGTNFLNFHFLEHRMAHNELDNNKAFYLANSGIERARTSFKIPQSISWTTVLQDPLLADPAPDEELCPFANTIPSQGCVIPPFGALVDTGIPFEDPLFDDGQYEVRAYNNEPGTVDTDAAMTFRARGTVHGEVKVLETTAQGTSGLRLITCQGDTGDDCPEDVDGNPDVVPMEGRDPAAFPELPSLDPPITDPGNYYHTPSNFPLLDPTCVFTETNGDDVQDNCYYFINGDAQIKGDIGNNVVIYATGKLTIATATGGAKVDLSNAILVGETSVDFSGNGTISAPLPYPAVISGGDITQSSGSATVYGTVYAVGDISVNPISVHGVMIGDDVDIQGGNLYTDDENEAYYELIPGFHYPANLLTNTSIESSWKEVR